jgi:ribosome-binding factor A
LTSRRQDQVSELIRHEVAEVLKRDVEFPRGTLVTVSRVTVSPDLEHATVFLSFWPVERRDELQRLAESHRGHVQHLLNRRLVMEHVPAITFAVDESEERADRLNRLLDSLDRG